MNRSELIIPFFKIILKSPSVILKALLHAVNTESKRKQVLRKYNKPNGLPVVDLLDVCPNFNVQISPYTFLKGTSPTIDIALVKAMAATFHNCSYLEIGTWRGESIANISEVAQECVSVSLSDKEMSEKKFPKKMIELQRLFSKDKNNITHIGHDSTTYDFSLLNQKFDLIFIDGNHEYEAVKSDTINAFKLLKSENSVIIWHDYANAYEDVNWSVLAGILDGATSEQQKKIYHVSNTLCAIYINTKYPTTELNYPSIPSKIFNITISARKI